ncbi:SDR family oxidoreductase [Microbacterium deminutum]|uniref:NAD(P)H-binding protein n=1 Tax=Microbacterium deminutum TaxID=344164 RepID=A0ABN2Q3B9_9MICO
MPVLVLGATGNVGPHVVNELDALGESVRVLVRDAGRARALLGDDAEVIGGDATDPAVLASALDGVESVFLLTPHAFDMSDFQLRVIRELRRTGIRIVKLSGTSSAITPDGPHACRQHWEIERVLEASGQPFVILRPNSFMQVLVGRLMLPALRATGRIMNPLGSAGISLIDARDVGAVAARVLTGHDWDGQTLALTGPRAITYPEIAQLVSARTGSAVDVVDITPGDVRTSLVARGTEEWEADHFAEMYELFRAGESEFVTDTVQQVTGRPPRTVEAYLDETLAPAGVDA